MLNQPTRRLHRTPTRMAASMALFATLHLACGGTSEPRWTAISVTPDTNGTHNTLDAPPDDPAIASDDSADPERPLPPDRDFDGIPDTEDACPDVPGPSHADPKKHGCPKVVITTCCHLTIYERVEFDTGKATIRAESHPILDAVLDILLRYPEIELVSIEGHTDSSEVPARSMRLSEDRAAAVTAWLIAKGIDPSRLTWQGFGNTKPIDSNMTEAGRQNNRRVDFQILVVGSKPPTPP